MLRTLSEWWGQGNEWQTWLTWQGNQLQSHYERSEIYDYYLSVYPSFRAPGDAVVYGTANEFYTYCFGNFAGFLVLPRQSANIIEYILLLLNLYDTCKGMTRKFTDPAGIALLRQVILRKNTDLLTRHDFRLYEYSYEYIHAHTVVQYSLSTLIMRFISNYMSYICPSPKFPLIRFELCQQAYNEKRFGLIYSKSLPIDIVPIPMNLSGQQSKGTSWPLDKSLLNRCSKCHRLTEHLWGSFHSCLDCHAKRICSMCGHPAILIASDDLPKCVIHQLPL